MQQVITKDRPTWSLGRFSLAFSAALWFASPFARSGEADHPAVPDDQKRYAPPIAAASDEGERALRSFQAASGLAIKLFAAEPLLANPVAFCFDEKGVVYVAETFRHGAGVTDTRGHMNWLDDDLACRTVADRVAMYKKFLGKEFETYHTEHERVKRLVDRDGDGKADDATVFADGFNDPAAGIGAGLLARKGDVWFTCIPWLWKLRDTKGDGVATERTLLHEGYGVHVGFLGHDLHGLIMGPDGKLYFSIGDRGFNVTTKEGTQLAVIDAGSVLRCNPDGTELEVFASGLRNPQELAFDEYGNLFTCDNNSDGGDKARWVYLVEGGDSGWRIGYQFLTSPVSRGPWNAERLWDPAQALKAPYLVPPIVNISDGPSGLAYNPGVTQLPDQYKKHFFLADFRGGSGQSGIRSFTIMPKGAWFDLTDAQQPIWRTLATDVDFGPDGALYFSDWVEGWEKPQKGRIYRVADPSREADPAVKEVQTLLAEGMEGRATENVAQLLAHADARVRREAQYELADRGLGRAKAAPDQAARQAATGALAATALSAGDQLARIHAIWGLGQIGHAQPAETPAIWTTFQRLLADQDPEIRAQAVKLVGDLRIEAGFARAVELLSDPSLRIRFFAAQSLGKLGNPAAAPALLAVLRENQDKDPYLRHAAVMGLAGLKTLDLNDAARDPSPSVRTGVLLAMRRHQDPAVAQFLGDADPALVLEAARAINDAPIEPAMPQLAALAVDKNTAMPVLRRVANANFRLGKPENASVLAKLAAQSDLPAAIRIESLAMLGEWARPSGRDKVMGLWRPLAERPASEAVAGVVPHLDTLLTTKPESVREQALRTIRLLAVKEAAAKLAALVVDPNVPDRAKSEAVKAIEAIGGGGESQLAETLLKSGGPKARVEAVRILSRTNQATASQVMKQILESGSAFERQGVLAILGESASPETEQALKDLLDQLTEGKVAPEIQLDLLEAVAKRGTPALKEKLAKFEESRSKTDHLANYREALAGGDFERGRQVFLTNTAASCLRCHKVTGEDGKPTGGEVGPDLSGIGSQRDREYILEAIVAPNEKIAQNFESVVLAMEDGKILTGVLREENDKEIRIITAEGEPITVQKSDVEDRQRGPSAMPADVVTKITKGEIRDLIEFLSQSKAK